MTVYGFHASHEQVPPGDLLAAVVRAEQAGFGAAMCSDHFSPWSERQGESGFAWAWLGAALQATGLTFGVVNAPGQRYHPAIIAQAISTLASMYPGRFWAALGSGEASNEHITGQLWPRKELRNQRLRESAEVIRDLLNGAEVSRDGLVTVDRARLWTRPEQRPDLLAAAVSPETAQWCADWADGLITVAAPIERLREVIAAYRDAGGTGQACLQVHLSYHQDEDEALRIAHEQWRTNVFAPPLCWDVDSVAVFDQAAEHVQPEAMRDAVRVSSDPGRHVDWLAEYAELGFDAIYLHHVGTDQSDFIDVFGDRVLPRLEVTAS
ncbi:TIGR03885 family FMN-dependent LLM class oxidoreductase [Kribbella sp. NBC_01245]|uniref:TIGR03885 family FMN-dependent LLM class oxidoreductase n=1 Tax=Kribbella sp. NBC_01245 TaxID=2903578 RepID=UPI002E2C6B65|nr:TIGR03885 family FMN-dependent LLM class oxidoreductase [Kribbella sp. NBC_01245]